MGEVGVILNLCTVPQFTTLQKVFARMPSGLLFRLIQYFAEVTLPPDAIVFLVAVDATGFTCDYASDWYCERTGRTRTAFMKLPVAVDTERLVLLGFSMSRTLIPEIRQAPLPFGKRIVMSMLPSMSWTRRTTPNQSIGSSWKT